MNYVLSILLAVCILVVIQYLLEVRVGSSIGMFDAELGLVAVESGSKRCTPGQFLGRVLPVQLVAIGLPLLAYDLLSGVLLFLISLLFFCRYEKKSPARASGVLTRCRLLAKNHF